MLPVLGGKCLHPLTGGSAAQVEEDMDLIADLKEMFDQAGEDGKGPKPSKKAWVKAGAGEDGEGGKAGDVALKRTPARKPKGGGGGAAAAGAEGLSPKTLASGGGGGGSGEKKNKRGMVRERGLTEAEMLEAAIAASLQEH